MTKAEVRACIEEVGIIPAVRVLSPQDALFAATTVCLAGIPIVEIAATIHRSVEVVSHLVKENIPGLIVGGEVVSDLDMARRYLDAGAKFLTSPVFSPKIVEFAAQQEVTIMPGALTPTEIITAWEAGADMVKVFPCSHVGGDSYIRALKGPFPRVPLVAAGGVNQQTASNFLLAGATALGVGVALVPKDAIRLRQADRIRELTRRFLGFVQKARADLRTGV